MSDKPDLLHYLAQEVRQMNARLDQYNETLVRNTSSLEEHMEQTRLLKNEITRVDNELKPVRRHVDLMNNLAKFVSVVLTAALAAKTFGLF